MILKDCLEKIIDNRGRNPKYYDREVYPVIDNVMIKNNYHPNINEATRFIDQDTHDNFLRGYLESNIPIMTLVGGGIGNVSLSIDDKSVIVQNTIGFKTKPELLDSIYLYYWFLYKHDELIQFNRGSGQPSIKKTDIENMNIELKSINYQRKVSKILSEIDEKIDLNNKVNNNLYEMCNVLYHQLLDDNESNIEYKTIGEIAKKVITGKTPSTKNKEYWGGNIPFITIPDMHNQVFTINTERYITKEGAKSLIPKNSISVSCIATVGLVSINDKDSQTNQQINSIVIENDYDLYYLFEFLTEQEQYMKSIAGGSTTYNINKNTFENIQVPYLNKELIIEYDKKVRPMFEKIKSNQISNDTLSQLRDTLLPKLMNGEIDLDNIEI